MDYGTVQRRRANFGVGIVQVNREAGVLDQKYGVGLWCQNRPEWQITGMKVTYPSIGQVPLLIPMRLGLHVTSTLHRLLIRQPRPFSN